MNKLILQPLYKVTIKYVEWGRKDPELVFCVTWGYFIGLHVAIVLLATFGVF